MALLLSGTAKVKVPEGAKPGDEITVKQEFEADQGPVDQIVASRLERDRKEDKAKIQDLEKKISDLAGEEGKTAAQEKRLKDLETELANSKTQEKIDKALRKAGAADLEDEFRTGIKVSSSDDDGDVEKAVKSAIERRKEFLKKHGAKAKEEGGVQTGRTGSGGSEDVEAEDKQFADLMALVKRNKPGLELYVNREGSKEKKIKLMQAYKAKGLLEPKAK